MSLAWQGGSGSFPESTLCAACYSFRCGQTRVLARDQVAGAGRYYVVYKVKSGVVLVSTPPRGW